MNWMLHASVFLQKQFYKLITCTHSLRWRITVRNASSKILFTTVYKLSIYKIITRKHTNQETLNSRFSAVPWLTQRPFCSHNYVSTSAWFPILVVFTTLRYQKKILMKYFTLFETVHTQKMFVLNNQFFFFFSWHISYFKMWLISNFDV